MVAGSGQAIVTLFQFALPRGERLTAAQIKGNGEGFNSRSREGSDQTAAFRAALIASFQFALPRGERLDGRTLYDIDFPFQFALPRGERQNCLC